MTGFPHQGSTAAMHSEPNQIGQKGGGKREKKNKKKKKSFLNVTGVLRRPGKGVAVNDDVVRGATGLAKIGRVCGRPGLGVQRAVGAVRDAVFEQKVCIEEILYGE